MAAPLREPALEETIPRQQYTVSLLQAMHFADLAGKNCALFFQACLQCPDINLSQIHAAAYGLRRGDSRRLSKGDAMRYKVEKVIDNSIG